MKVNLAVGCANKRMENSSFLLTSVSCWPKDVWHSWNVLIVLLSLLQVFCLDATRWAYWVRGHTCPWIHSTCLSRALSYSSYFPVRLCCDPSVRWSALTIYFDMCGAQSQQWMCYCMNDPSRLCLQSEDRAFSLPPPCPTMEEHLSVSSDLPQSPRFCYSNQILHLFSDPLLLEDQLPWCHRGDLSTATAISCLDEHIFQFIHLLCSLSFFSVWRSEKNHRLKIKYVLMKTSTHVIMFHTWECHKSF